jgi:TonB family protein
MIYARALVIGTIAACGSAHLVGQQELVPAGPQQKQRLCGRVVSITCSDSRPPTIALSVSPTVIVQVRPESEEGRRPWPYASQLRHREACAVGRLTQEATLHDAAVFTIPSISAITVTREVEPDDWVPPGVATSCDAGVQLPTRTKWSQPNYPREAVAAARQGTVLLEAIVGIDGQIRRARVVRSIDIEYGIDFEALDTVKRWRFAPATKDGEATPFLMIASVSFTLTKRRP